MNNSSSTSFLLEELNYSAGYHSKCGRKPPHRISTIASDQNRHYDHRCSKAHLQKSPCCPRSFFPPLRWIWVRCRFLWMCFGSKDTCCRILNSLWYNPHRKRDCRGVFRFLLRVCSLGWWGRSSIRCWRNLSLIICICLMLLSVWISLDAPIFCALLLRVLIRVNSIALTPIPSKHIILFLHGALKPLMAVFLIVNVQVWILSL